MTKPTKQQILDCIESGMNIHQQAKHFRVSQWKMSKWRKSYGLGGVKIKQTHTPMFIKKKRDFHRQSPVNILGSANYDYAKHLERDFKRLHKEKYSDIPYPIFREAINYVAKEVRA